MAGARAILPVGEHRDKTASAPALKAKDHGTIPAPRQMLDVGSRQCTSTRLHSGIVVSQNAGPTSAVNGGEDERNSSGKPYPHVERLRRHLSGHMEEPTTKSRTVASVGAARFWVRVTAV